MTWLLFLISLFLFYFFFLAELAVWVTSTTSLTSVITFNLYTHDSEKDTNSSFMQSELLPTVTQGAILHTHDSKSNTSNTH